MLKTLKNLFKQDKEKFVVPKSVQSVIPIKTIWEDGIFLVGKNKYAKTFKFEDINYAVASREDKEAMFLEYSELLNSLDSGATTKITINNRRLNKADFEQTILIPMADDGLDKYRKEYNKMLLEKATGANSIVQDKYVTVSVCKKNIEEARNYFARVGADLIAHFSRLGSRCVELEAEEKLRIFHDFYRTGEETAFRFDISQTMRKGHDFKDFICPDTFEFEKDCFRMGDRYGRVIFLREYAAYIKDSMVAELCELNRNMMLSVDIIPVPTDEAVREVENRLLGVETNITNWQRKQNQNNNFSAVVPYDLEQQRKESKEFLDDLTTRDQRMMFAVLTMVHTADSKEQLDSDTEALLTTARKHLCQFAVLKYQQMDGLNTVLPFGVRKIDALRTLTTESLAVFIPFRVQEIYHENGVYYGQNVISKNMIIANRRHLLNGNSFILGVSGAGKSFTAKEEMTNIILTDPNADIIIIDPEREYSPLVKAMQGEVIHISATSENHINAMDMNSDYGDGANPVILKSEFILSLCEQLIGLFHNALDRRESRGQLDENVKAVLAETTRRSLGLGIVKLLEDRTDFSSSSQLDFQTLRKEILDASAQLLRGNDTLPQFGHWEERIREMLPENPLVGNLYGDLPENDRLLKFDDIDARGLLERYNLAQVQALLLTAREMKVKVGARDAAQLRRLCQYLRFFQLLAEIKDSPEESGQDGDGALRWLEMTVDGPAAVLDTGRRYGLALATFFPAVCTMPWWRLEAQILWKGRLFQLELDQDSRLKCPYHQFSAVLPEEVALFRNHFLATDSEWRIVEEAPFLKGRGGEMIFPDYSFRRKGSRRIIHLELFHRWHSRDLAERLAWLDAHPAAPLVVGIDRALLKRAEIETAVENSPAFQEAGFLYRDYPTIDKTLKSLKKRIDCLAGE